MNGKGKPPIDFIAHAIASGKSITPELIQEQKEQKIREAFSLVEESLQALDEAQENKIAGFKDSKIPEKEQYLYQEIQSLITLLVQEPEPVTVKATLVGQLAIIENQHPQEYIAIRKKIFPDIVSQPYNQENNVRSIISKKVEIAINDIISHHKTLLKEKELLEEATRQAILKVVESIKKVLELITEKPQLLDEINEGVLQAVKLCQSPEETVIILFPYIEHLTLYHTEQKQHLFESILLALKDRYPEAYIAVLAFGYKDRDHLFQVIKQSTIPEETQAIKKAIALLNNHRYFLQKNRLQRIMDIDHSPDESL